MNTWIGMGRLVRDPEVRVSSTGENKVAKFTLAVNRRGKKEERQQPADFISCVAFDKVAELLEKYAKQGTKLVVKGRIQTGSYTNKDGQKVYTTDVITEDIEFAESKSASSDNKAAEEEQGTDGFVIPDVDADLPFK